MSPDMSIAGTFIDTNDRVTLKQEKSNIAETWWGSHYLGPTYIQGSTERLKDFPFLLKVISVGKALSIQVHPNAINAYYLHVVHPEIYTDSNPKPEIAVAITEFEALCGFLPEEDVSTNLASFPEFATIAGGKDMFETKFLVARLLDCPKNVVAIQLESLKKRLDAKPDCTEAEKIILSLLDDYPEDVGALSPLFMNHVILQPGDALVVPPQEIHCYLSGQAVECMAPSDNVVRVGLTSKFCDVKTFLSLVNSTHTNPQTIAGAKYDHEQLKEYFTLYKLTNGDDWKKSISGSPCILLVVSGTGDINNQRIIAGDSWLILTDEIYRIRGEELVVVVAEGNLRT